MYVSLFLLNVRGFCITTTTVNEIKMMDSKALAEWAKDKPLSVLQLDAADRAVLRVAGRNYLFIFVISESEIILFFFCNMWF